MFKQYKLKNYHFLLIIYLAALTMIGIVVVGSAKHSVMNKQVLGFVLGMIVMIFLSFWDYSYLLKFTNIYYVGMVMLLILVKTGIGNDSHGAQRWIKLGPVQFQPSELCKIMIILYFAEFFVKYRETINTAKTLMISMILAGIPMALVLTQPDTSTTIVLIFIFAVLLYLGGLSYKIILSVLAVSAPVVLLVVVYVARNIDTLVQDHYQFRRIMGWLDPYNPLYTEFSAQTRYSIMAIGSGMMTGKGLNTDMATSLKNSNFISEPQTDFIFAVAGEELGFVGGAAIIILLLLIVIECLVIGAKAKDLSGRMICCGMASLVAFQTFVNLCVTMGLMPNTGVTLPFVSYGLTSLVSLYIGMGFVLNVGLQPRKSKKGGLL